MSKDGASVLFDGVVIAWFADRSAARAWARTRDFMEGRKACKVRHGFAAVVGLMGAKGGASKSDAKVQAARENGKKGGRPLKASK